MKYKLTVVGFDSGLNELLSSRTYDVRRRCYHNFVKQKNDEICCKAIRFSKALKGAKIDKPIAIHYDIYAKDKRRDRMNIVSAFDKSFQDALQLCKVIKNDGWDDVVHVTWNTYIDRKDPRIEVTITEIEVLEDK